MSQLCHSSGSIFPRDAYLVDVNPSSSYDGTIAGEVGAAFSAMVAGRKNHVSLLALKSKVGEFHHQFSGSKQNDSHEFLTYLLAWLHEDISLPALVVVLHLITWQQQGHTVNPLS